MAMEQKNTQIDPFVLKEDGYVIKKKDISNATMNKLYYLREITKMIKQKVNVQNIDMMGLYSIMGNGKKIKNMGYALK